MYSIPRESLVIVLRDVKTAEWLSFRDATDLFVARHPTEVAAVLERTERALLSGQHVAGFLAYEAAPAFDPAFRARVDDTFPCAVFGVFDPPTVVDAPAVPLTEGSELVGPLRPSIDRAAFSRAVSEIREAIREGDTYQVNHTYRLTGKLRSDPWDLFRSLVQAQAATCAAWVEAGRWAIASASPELFFRRTGDRIESRPMKGTAARGRPGKRDRDQLLNLLASAKERAENLMIVDMVRNDLSRIAEPGTVGVTGLFVPEAYPTVWQLTSIVNARSQASLSDVFGALFPAASITGAPKASTMSIIERMESTPRRIYTGSIGYAAPDGTAQFNVAIRTALIDRDSARVEYGVGGGIVWDSGPDSEWKETRTKARILHHDTQEFRLLETLKWSPSQGFALLEDHLARLGRSGAEFGFRVDRARVLGALTDAAGRFPRKAMRVRVTVGRAGDPEVDAGRLGRERRFVRPKLALAPAAIASVDPFLRHKTTRRDTYDRMLALCPNADDALLWNEHGEMTESCFANLFLERDGVLVTPPARCGLLPGTLRSRLLADGRAREAVLRPEDLSTGRVLLGNSVRGLYEPESIEDLRAVPGSEVRASRGSTAPRE